MPKDTTLDFAAIQREQEAFNAKLAAMLAEHEGEFVLFKDGEPVRFFDDYQKAYRAGLERFGTDDTFLVSEVKTRQPETTSLTWAVGAM